MQYSPLSASLLLTLLIAAPASAVANKPAADSHTEADASNAFVVLLTPDTTKSNVIQQIVAAGHDQLATACAGNHGASVSIFNPLEPGSYKDMPCSAILDGDDLVWQSSEALPSGGGEGIGEVQQKWSPFGLGCGIFVGLAAAIMSHGLCDYPGAQQPEACHHLAEGGFFGLSIMCAFL